ALNDADLANLRQEISTLKYGATRECSEGNVRLSFAWLYSKDSAVASLVDSRAACPGESSKYLRFTLGLNNLYTSIEARFRPLL
ncbi:MAG TPA: hypothetical protein VKP30_32835, partial [Polyangiaceae bacterium]|nr:hypothetical protein [Polyangiaceae bacterium]